MDYELSYDNSLSHGDESQCSEDKCSLGCLIACEGNSRCVKDGCESTDGLVLVAGLIVPVLMRLASGFIQKSICGSETKPPQQQGLLGNARQKTFGVLAKGFTADDCFHCGYPPVSDGGNTTLDSGLSRLASAVRGKMAGQDDLRGTSIATGHKPTSSWQRAVVKTHGSGEPRDKAPVLSAVTRFIFWHCAQPVVYFCLMYIHYDSLDGTHQLYARGILHREIIYLISLILCVWSNPAFLLVDVRASYQTCIGDKPNLLDRAVIGNPITAGVGVGLSDGYCFRFYYASGWRFLFVFALAPEKFVITALLAPHFLNDTISAEQQRRFLVLVPLWILLLLLSVYYDLLGFFAIMHEPGKLPISVLLAFAVCGAFGAITVAMASVVAVVLVGGGCLFCCCRGQLDAARRIGGSE